MFPKHSYFHLFSHSFHHKQQAFYYGRLPVARMLLNKKANMEAKDIYGLTASHLAVDANQGEILKFALENGANIEARDACGWTLLMRAGKKIKHLLANQYIICNRDVQ